MLGIFDIINNTENEYKNGKTLHYKNVLMAYSIQLSEYL